MANSATLTIGYDGGSRAINKTITESGSARVDVEETVADSETDYQIIVPAIDVSALKLIYILSDQDVTVETNSGTAADDTLALKADEPYVWHVSDLNTKLLTTDIGVNGIYVTNASGSSATINLLFIIDATP